jgi:hypothetical protein
VGGGAGEQECGEGGFEASHAGSVVKAVHFTKMRGKVGVFRTAEMGDNSRWRKHAD